jgi:hypothetical protein
VYKDASGNVGIGTSSPSVNLDVQKTGTVVARARSLDTTGSTVGAVAAEFAGGSSLAMYAGSNYTFLVSAGATDPLIIGTANAEKMRLTSGGNVGIGTISPVFKLHVNDTTTSAVARFAGAAVNSNSFIELYDGGGAANFGAIGGGNAYIFTAGYNAFYTGSSEKMRLDSSGSLLVGTTSSSDNTSGIKLSPPSSGSSGTLKCMKTATGGINAILNYHSGTYVGGINFDNTSTSFPTSSDIRLKKDIVDAPSATQKIDNIRIVSHGWKHDDAVVEFGVIAQELLPVAPNAVMQGDDGEEVVTTWSVDYSKLVPLLIKAHQEQQALITQLQTDVATLKGAA